MGEKHYLRTKKMKSKTRKDGNLSKRQMFDFYPTCLEKNRHVGIFTPDTDMLIFPPVLWVIHTV